MWPPRLEVEEDGEVAALLGIELEAAPLRLLLAPEHVGNVLRQPEQLRVEIEMSRSRSKCRDRNVEIEMSRSKCRDRDRYVEIEIEIDVSRSMHR